jgi:Spy/CpxP family protein refolding chaperone
MKRVACLGVVAAVLVFAAVTVTYSQVRRFSSTGGGSSQQGGAGTFEPRTHEEFMRDMAQRQREFQQQMEEMQRQAEESRNRAIQETLRAGDEQWRQLKPKLDRIERLKAEAVVALDPGSFSSAGGSQGGGMGFSGGFAGGGGSSFGPSGTAGSGRTPNRQNWSRTWTWGSPGTSRRPMEMTAGEVLCDELQRLLYSPSAAPAEIAGRIEALRKIRAKAQDDLAAARKELRGMIAPHQEAPLVLMGYLD